jgi:spore germination protein YaaH
MMRRKKMSKQSLFMTHKDEAFAELVRRQDKAIMFKQKMIDRCRCSNNDLNPQPEAEAVNHGWIQCLKKTIGLNLTEERKNEESSQSIDNLTNKEVNNDSSNE